MIPNDIISLISKFDTSMLFFLPAKQLFQEIMLLDPSFDPYIYLSRLYQWKSAIEPYMHEYIWPLYRVISGSRFETKISGSSLILTVEKPLKEKVISVISDMNGVLSVSSQETATSSSIKVIFDAQNHGESKLWINDLNTLDYLYFSHPIFGPMIESNWQDCWFNVQKGSIQLKPPILADHMYESIRKEIESIDIFSISEIYRCKFIRAQVMGIYGKHPLVTSFIEYANIVSNAENTTSIGTQVISDELINKAISIHDSLSPAQKNEWSVEVLAMNEGNCINIVYEGTDSKLVFKYIMFILWERYPYNPILKTRDIIYQNSYLSIYDL